MQEKSARKTSVTRTAMILALLAILITIIISPERYMESMKNGLLVFISSVLPALFPFFFITRLLTSLGLATTLGNMLKSPIKKLYNAPPIGGYIMCMSLVSGYPIGAKLLANAYHDGLISNENARRLLPMTSMPGPLFVIGTLGTGLLNDTRLGYIILISCILGSVLNGLLYNIKKASYNAQKEEFRPLITDNILENAINDSILSILAVGGYIAIFYVISDILLDIGILKTLSNCIGKIFALDTDFSLGISLSLVEMTRGILIFKNSSQIMAKTIITSGIVSFGGLAILVQSMTYLSTIKIKVSYYLKTKLTQSIFTMLISYILCIIMLT